MRFFAGNPEKTRQFPLFFVPPGSAPTVSCGPAFGDPGKRMAKHCILQDGRAEDPRQIIGNGGGRSLGGIGFCMANPHD
jgi:hypothetical protein